MQDQGTRMDVVVVGAGFAGLYALYKLRSIGLTVQVIEAGAGVGGTWYWNRYPGARCDVESLEYSYSFSSELEQEWEWSERYASQPEILRYLDHVADRFELRGDIQFNTRVTAAHYSEQDRLWAVTADSGVWVAQFVVMATGNLSTAQAPEIAGMERFEGEIYHTGEWPDNAIDFTGKRVGVVGTGSSGIQAIPVIARDAEHMTVFQRTAAFSVPAQNRPLEPEEQQSFKSRYKAIREANKSVFLGFGSEYESDNLQTAELEGEDRQARYEQYWQRGGLHFMGVFTDLMISEGANDAAADFVRGKIEAAVDDPVTAKKLLPKQVIGCKRLCSDTGYYEAFNRPNVSLVDIEESPIVEFDETGIVADKHYALDEVVFATGFDAMTGTLNRIDIRGREGTALTDKWSAGPLTYLGLGSSGFPNLFVIAGPGSPSVLSNFLPTIELHVDWIADAILHLKERGLDTIEATVEAESEWVQHANDIASFTLYGSCNSWYLGSNVPGKPRVFMPYLGYPMYVAKCEEVAANAYEGFALS